MLGRSFARLQRGRVQSTKLSNGMRVVTQDTYDQHTSIGAYFNAGIREEARDARGSYNVLRALTANGATKKYKGKGPTALHTDLANMGADMNLDFGREQSSIALTVPNGAVTKSLEMLKDLSFGVDASDKGAVDEAKTSLYRQMTSQPPLIQDTVYDRLHASTFRDYSLGYTLFNADVEEGSDQIKLQQLIERSRTSDRLVISAVGGGVKHAEMVQQCEKLFADAPRGAPGIVDEKPYFCGASLNYRTDEMGPNAYWAMGFQTCPMAHNDALPIMLMEDILGEYVSFRPKALVPNNISHNRLTHLVAQQRGGCAHYHKAKNFWYRDTGMLTFYGITDELDLMSHMRNFQFHLSGLSAFVTDEELERAKKAFQHRMFQGNDGTLARAGQMAEQTIHLNRVLNPAELMERLENTNSDDIKRVAFNYLNNTELSVVAVGPTHGLRSHFTLSVMMTNMRY